VDLNLAGRRVLITGASRGIGRAIAEAFAAEGAHVGLCARTEEPLAATAHQLQASGATVIAAPVDVTDPDAVRRWVDTTAEAMGGLDVVVPTVSAQSRDWRTSVETDLLATVELIDHCVPRLEKSQTSSIVLITSQAGLLAVPNYKAYSAVKAALTSYAGALARELAPLGIRVNSVAPGEVLFDGGIWDRLRTQRPEKYAATLSRNVTGRFCTPAEVARVVVFLASPAASYISGTNILIDGANRQHIQF
jgi:3-oxoacyl-[acyl-carrier protein] reductase